MINRRTLQYFSVALAFVVSSGLLLSNGPWQPGNFLGAQPVFAQRIRPDGVWQQVYQKLPNLPLENQYVNKETDKVDSDNTFVGRLIRYHLYVKGRSPFYRFDWKLTLADYLGVSGAMDEGTYPSHNTLKKSPVEGDVAAINRLNRSQRDALVQALVDAFTPQAANTSRSAPTPSTPKPSPTPGPINSQPVRGSGGAQLLLPQK